MPKPKTTAPPGPEALTTSKKKTARVSPPPASSSLAGDGATDVIDAVTAHEQGESTGEAVPTKALSKAEVKELIPSRDEGPVGDLQVTKLGPKDFPKETLLRVYKTMLTARRLDEKMLNLLKQGKGFFHIGTSGHEGVQAALGLYAKGGHDWFCLYYRDLTLTLMLGMTAKDAMLAHLAKADDVSSGGRQMPEHFGSRALNIMTTSSSIGAHFVPATGYGLALLREGAKSDAFVVASSGDGGTSQGAFHEAMNWAARAKAPVMFLVQDNKYAISVPVKDQTAGGSAYHFGAGYVGMSRMKFDGTDFFESASVMAAAEKHLRERKGPLLLVCDVVRLLPHSSSDSQVKYRPAEELDADKAIDPLLRLEAQLVEAGVLDAATIERLRQEVVQEVNDAADWAETMPDPDPATATRHILSETPPVLDYEASKPSGELVVVVDAINHAIREEMTRNDKVIVYGEDVAGGKGGVFTATRDLTATFGEDRCFNSPLAEHSIIGTAVAFASYGYKPVVEIQFADYIWPAMQSLRNQVGPFRYRSNGTWSCPMVIRVPCGGYIHGGLCHSQNIEAIFSHFPGYKVVMPSNAADAKGLLKTAIRSDDPIIFLEHKALYRMAAARSPEPDADYLVEIGKAKVVREGSDLTIVTYGMMVHKAMNVAKTLEKEGISAEIIDIRTMLPLDTETILASVKKTHRALVVYEDHEFMGFGAEIAAQIADKAFAHLDAPVKRLAGAFSWIGFAAPYEDVLLPQDPDILAAARDLMAF